MTHLWEAMCQPDKMDRDEHPETMLQSRGEWGIIWWLALCAGRGWRWV